MTLSEKTNPFSRNMPKRRLKKICPVELDRYRPGTGKVLCIALAFSALGQRDGFLRSALLCSTFILEGGFDIID